MEKSDALPGGLEPPTFRLTAERANQLRHGSCGLQIFLTFLKSNVDNRDIRYV